MAYSSYRDETRYLADTRFWRCLRRSRRNRSLMVGLRRKVSKAVPGRLYDLDLLKDLPSGAAVGV